VAWRDFFGFLRIQRNLKKLKISESDNFPHDMDLPCLSLEIALDALEIDFTPEDGREDVHIAMTDASRIVSCFRNQAKNVAIKGLSGELSNNIYESLLQWKGFKFMLICLDGFPSDEAYYGRFPENFEIQKLKINISHLENAMPLSQILMKYRGIQDLEINVSHVSQSLVPEDLDMINRLSSLTNFKLNCKGMTTNLGAFSKITELSIAGNASRVDWRLLAESNPSLTTLKISWISESTIISILEGLESLKILDIRSSLKVTKALLLRIGRTNVAVVKIESSQWNILNTPLQAMSSLKIKDLQILRY
jgi:hypothetical protein